MVQFNLTSKINTGVRWVLLFSTFHSGEKKGAEGKWITNGQLVSSKVKAKFEDAILWITGLVEVSGGWHTKGTDMEIPCSLPLPTHLLFLIAHLQTFQHLPEQMGKYVSPSTLTCTVTALKEGIVSFLIQSQCIRRTVHNESFWWRTWSLRLRPQPLVCLQVRQSGAHWRLA